MAKQARFFQKIFASNAPANQIGKFGSFAADAPSSAANPDEIQSLQQFIDGWNSAVTEDNAPCIEDFNALANLFSYQLSYLLTAGVAEWHAGTTYYIGHIVSDGYGALFKSLINNNLNSPTTVSSNWKKIGGTPLWVSGDLYKKGDLVRDTQGKTYRYGNNTPNNTASLTTVTVWAPVERSIPRWLYITRYDIGDIVIGDQDYIYKSLQNNNISRSISYTTWWRRISPSVTLWNTTTPYSVGDLAVNSAGEMFRSRSSSNINRALSNEAYWGVTHIKLPAYHAYVVYATGDIVSNGIGNLYRALQSSSGQALSNETYWKILYERIPLINTTHTYDVQELAASTTGDIFRSIKIGNKNKSYTDTAYWQQITSTGILGVWDSTRVYNDGDLVVDAEGSIYKSRANNQSNNTLSGTYWVPVNTRLAKYNTVVPYSTGDLVMDSSGVMYRSKKSNNTGHSLTSESWWEVLYDRIPVKKSTITYSFNDLVSGADGNIYKSISSNNKNKSLSSKNYWRRITSEVEEIEENPNCVIEGYRATGINDGQPTYLTITGDTNLKIRASSSSPFKYRINGVDKTRTSDLTYSGNPTTNFLPIGTIDYDKSESNLYSFENTGFLPLDSVVSSSYYGQKAALGGVYSGNDCVFRCTDELKIREVEWDSIQYWNNNFPVQFNYGNTINDPSFYHLLPVFLVASSSGDYLSVGARSLIADESTYNTTGWTTGDVRWDRIEQQWYKWSGTAWNTYNAVLVGEVAGILNELFFVKPADFERDYQELNTIRLNGFNNDQNAIDTDRTIKKINVEGEVLEFDSSYIVAESTTSIRYHYITYDGLIIYNDFRPNYYPNRKGWYCPNRMMRCFGISYYKSSNDSACGSYGFNSLNDKLRVDLSYITTSTNGGGTALNSLTPIPMNAMSRRGVVGLASNLITLIPYPIIYKMILSVPLNREFNGYIIMRANYDNESYKISSSPDYTNKYYIGRTNVQMVTYRFGARGLCTLECMYYDTYDVNSLYVLGHYGATLTAYGTYKFSSILIEG